MFGASVLITAILCFIISRPKPDPNNLPIKVTEASSLGARLAALDDASMQDVADYERRLALVSQNFKESQSQVSDEIQASAKSLKHDGKSATMSEYLTGLSFMVTLQPWQTVPFYCKAYEQDRKEGDENEQAWQEAGLATQPVKK